MYVYVYVYVYEYEYEYGHDQNPPMQARDVHDVCLYRSYKSAMPKLQFVNEHAPWAMVESDPGGPWKVHGLSGRALAGVKVLGRRGGKRLYSPQEASCTRDGIYKGLAKQGIGSTGG